MKNRFKKVMVKESYEVSEELVEMLNSVLADEWLANRFYILCTVAMKGSKQCELDDVAKENAFDELDDHYTNLYKWMQSKGIPVVTSPSEYEEITNCTKFVVEDGESTRSVIKKLIQSEEEAIDVYEDLIPETELDLNTMLCGFLKDEREHLKKLNDILDDMDDNGSSGGYDKYDDDDEEDEEVDDGLVMESLESAKLDPYFSDSFDLSALSDNEIVDLLNAVYKELDAIEDLYKNKRFGRKQSHASFMNDIEDYKMKRDILTRNQERLENIADDGGNAGEGFQI